MNLLFLFISIIPLHGKALLTKTDSIAVDSYEVRLAPWQITMKRIIGETDTCYYLLFRDQHAVISVSMTTMEFENLEELKYVAKGLATLKNGSNGDIAEYEHFTIKKWQPPTVKKEDAWYILSYGAAVTNFQQAQANRLIYIINNYKTRSPHP